MSSLSRELAAVALTEADQAEEASSADEADLGLPSHFNVRRIDHLIADPDAVKLSDTSVWRGRAEDIASQALHAIDLVKTLALSTVVSQSIFAHFWCVENKLMPSAWSGAGTPPVSHCFMRKFGFPDNKSRKVGLLNRVAMYSGIVNQSAGAVLHQAVPPGLL